MYAELVSWSVIVAVVFQAKGQSAVPEASAAQLGLYDGRQRADADDDDDDDATDDGCLWVEFSRRRIFVRSRWR